MTCSFKMIGSDEIQLELFIFYLRPVDWVMLKFSCCNPKLQYINVAQSLATDEYKAGESI